MARSNFIGDGNAGGAAAPDTQGDPSSPEETRVRNALLTGTSIDDTLSAVRNSYSTDLQQRGADLTRYLQREDNSPRARGTYLDPNEYMALLARGMSPKDTAAALLRRAGMAPSAANIKDLTAEMQAKENIPYVGLTRTQDPHAMRNMYSTAPQAGAIVPASAFFGPEAHIPGLTHAQNLEFIDRHEGWHLKDNQNWFNGIDPAKMKGYDTDNLREMLGKPVQLHALSLNNRQESLADVGAAGDMIRNGADPSIIANVAAWRRQTNSEVSHMTAQALDGLQRKINEMGVDKFRSLSDDDAHKLYQQVAADNSLQPNQTEAAVRYVTGTVAERAASERAASRDPNVASALAFVNQYQLPPPRVPGKKPTPSTPAATADDNDIQRQAMEFHPVLDLRQRAFDDSGVITPLTITRAYGAMQDEFRQALDAQPDNKVYQAMAQRLQDNFVNAVQKTPYIAENAARGVDIFAAAPQLRGSTPPAPGTTTPAPTTTSPAPASPRARTPAPST